MKIINVVVAAGSGTRFGGAKPKQFLELEPGRTVLDVSVERLRRFTDYAPTVVVVSPGYESEVPEGCTVVCGGATRSESVANAIKATAELDADVILIHDGARPLVTRPMIDRLTAAMVTHQGAIPVVEVVDSLRNARTGQPVERGELRRVQTPQAFRADLLRESYRKMAGHSFTDDASLMTAAGYTDITLTEGDEQTLKITRPIDLEVARIYLTNES